MMNAKYLDPGAFRLFCDYITLDSRLPFPESVRGIFLVQPLTQKEYQSIEWRGYID